MPHHNKRDREKPVLDPCCGSRMFWFDKTDERAVFGDIRKENLSYTDRSSQDGARQLRKTWVSVARYPWTPPDDATQQDLECVSALHQAARRTPAKLSFATIKTAR